MPTRLAAALSVALLAAGSSGVTLADDVGTLTATRTTVIAKNSQWPIAGYITVEPCKRKVCWDI